VVQEPGSAQYQGMPESALATGVADYVEAPADIPERLLQYASSPCLSANTAPGEHRDTLARSMRSIISLLLQHTRHDFGNYKQNTLWRRVERRMNLNQIVKTTDYVRFLEENPVEIDKLFSELLICVTRFFRDPEAWSALTQPLTELLCSPKTQHPLRIWVPGCCTGEEVYSLAIVLKELKERLGSTRSINIFGTDLDEQSISKARTGQYPDGISLDVSPERLARYFTHNEHGYRIRKEIRELAIFARQDLIGDPPFTRLDIVFCRNVFIYFNAELQQKLLEVFHYAINPGGLLLLGPSETIGTFVNQFDVLDRRWKLFRRRSTPPSLPSLQTAGSREGKQMGRVKVDLEKRVVAEPSVSSRIERVLLERFTPASVIVDRKGDVVYVHGHTGSYLQPPRGRPSNNLLLMAQEGLELDLAEAMKLCAETGEAVHRARIEVTNDSGTSLVDFSVEKLTESEALRDFTLITFCATPGQPIKRTPKSKKRAGGHDERVAQLQRELRYLQEIHQTTLEELETSNEELKSSNEELQSTNEELQSSNEEMETSHEEMQSLNEELATVNAELLSKLDDLSAANDDMRNLLNSTKIGTLFLDTELRIKRYTEQARHLVSVRESDLGRPLAELVCKISDENLVEACRDVLRDLVFIEREIFTTDGRNYLMRIMPYRTAENAIDGVVLTFIDIDRLKFVQKELRRFTEVFRDGSEPIILVDLRGNVLDLNNLAVTKYNDTGEQLLGKPLSELFGAAAGETVDGLLERCRLGELVRGIACRPLMTTGDTQESVELSLSLITDDRARAEAIAVTISQSSDQ
jgi:two-component system CheB/CheR fusion protein